MPSASDEDRKVIMDIFGTCDCAPIIRELEDRGFELTKGWEWKRSSSPNHFEEILMSFLVDEWDFGYYAS